MQDRADALDAVTEVIAAYLDDGGYYGASLTVALSGGADSVCLLYALCALRATHALTLAALHVHHGIRGEEADRDLAFCEQLTSSLEVPLRTYAVDAPAYAEVHGLSLESAARELRYQCFREYHESHSSHLIVTAHHADDNAETVLFRMARGTGLRGLTGIPAKRDFYLRPCLSLRAAQMRHALETRGIDYCVDSSNHDTTYTRNYIRHRLLPALEAVHGSAVENLSRMTVSLGEDEAFLMSLATRALEGADAAHLRRAIASEPPPVGKRMLWLLYEEVRLSRDAMTAEQLDAAYTLVIEDRVHAELNMPAGVVLYLERETLVFSEKREALTPARHPLTLGVNLLPETGECVILSESPIVISDFPSLNIYKLLIHSTLCFDTMEVRLYARGRIAGDHYRYGGITRSVKKLYNDHKLPLAMRARRPIICDEEGILWIPGFGVRDDAGKEKNKGEYRIYACYCGFSETI